MEDPVIVRKELNELEFNTNSVYLLVNDNTGEYYIGSTNSPNVRYRQHYQSLKNNTHQNKLLQKAFNDDPDFKFIVAPVDSRVIAHVVENELLSDSISDPKNLNIAPPLPESYLNRNISLESKQIMSDSMKERWKDKDYRDKMIGLCKDRWNDPEYRTIMKEANLKMQSQPGYFEKVSEKSKAYFTEENRKKKSDKDKEKWKDPGYRSTMKANFKKVWTEDEKIAMSEKNKEIWKDSELIEHNSQKSKEMWERPGYRESIMVVRQTPEFKEKHSNAVKEAMNRPEVKAKVSVYYKPVSIDGTIYDSLSEAASALGLYPSTLHYKLNVSKNKNPNWSYVQT